MRADIWKPGITTPWNIGTAYLINAVVLRSGFIYTAVESNVGKAPESNPAIWTKLYQVGQNVKYDNSVYECVIAHNPSTLFKTDFLARRWNRLSWDLPRPWIFRHLYSENEIVLYGHIHFVCVSRHESSASFRKDFYTTPITSSTSHNIGYGSLTFVVTGNTIAVNERVRCSCTLPGKSKTFVEGFVTSSSPTSLTVSVDSIGGVDSDSVGGVDPDSIVTVTSWNIYVKVWEYIPLRKKQAPPWMQDSPFIADYISASDETLLDQVDMPIVELGRLRQITIDTHPEIVSRTSKLLGFDLSKFSWLLSGTFLNYVIYLSRYKSVAGTDKFMLLLNFLLKQRDPTDTWTLTQLYTRNYLLFYRPETLPVNPVTNIYTTEIYENDPGIDYVCTVNYAPIYLMMGSNLHYPTLTAGDPRIGHINPNVTPADTLSKWSVRSSSLIWTDADAAAHKGIWNPFIPYNIGDIVHVGSGKPYATSRYELTSGKFYKCTVASGALSTNQYPTTNPSSWALISSITTPATYRSYWNHLRPYTRDDIVHLPLDKSVVDMFYMLAPSEMVLYSPYPDYNAVIFGIPRLVEITPECSEIEEGVTIQYLCRNVAKLSDVKSRKIVDFG